MFQCQLEFTDDALIAIAHIAMEKHTGARGLRSEVVSIVLSITLIISHCS